MGKPKPMAGWRRAQKEKVSDLGSTLIRVKAEPDASQALRMTKEEFRLLKMEDAKKERERINRLNDEHKEYMKFERRSS